MKATALMKILIPLLFTILTVSLAPAQFSSDIRIEKTNEHYELGDWIGYSNCRFVNSIAIGTQFIYFATTGGITRYNFYDNEWDFPWTSCNGMAHNHAICVAYDENTNQLWCSSPVGISHYEPFSRIWYNSYYDDFGVDSDDFVLSIGFTSSEVWLQTGSGQMFRKNKDYGSFTSAGSINYSENNEIIWFGQRGKSERELPLLFMSDGYLFESQKTITDPNMRRYDVTYYVFDKWGYLWIATWGLGAARADTRTQQMDLLPFGLYQANSTALALEDDRIWIGAWDPEYDRGTDWGEENGVTFWNMRDDTWKYFQAKYITDFNDDQTNRIKIDGSRIWFANERSLNEYIKDRSRWYSYDQTDRIRNNFIYDVEVNSEYVWVATPAGIDQMAKRSIHSDSAEIKRVAYDALREVEVYDIDLAGDTLWAGTRHGAYLYDVAKDSGHFFEGDWSPGVNPVTAVGVSPNVVWFGTEDEVFGFDFRKNKWLPSPARFSRINSQVNDIQATEKVVFVATDEGVWKYDVDREYWKQFTIEDGLLSQKVNEMKIVGDYVWFATAEGICRFYWNNPMRID
jgi:ligand-binding sensor domain-containing protein